MTMIEFLRARLDEDTVAAALISPHPTWYDRVNDSDFRLAECTSKRKIIDDYDQAMTSRDTHPNDVALAGALLALHRVVKRLALPYADHPDYDDAWRP